MSDIKNELKNIILEVMIPESKAYINELNTSLKNNNLKEDDTQAKKEMEIFITELEDVLVLLDENKISNKEIEVILKKINNMLEEHQ